MKYNKFIVALIILLNAGAFAALLWAFVKVGAEPVVLIGAWFAFTTGELFLVAGIKKKEIKKEKDDEI